MARLAWIFVLYLPWTALAAPGFDYIWITPDPPGKTHKNIQEMGIKWATFQQLRQASDWPEPQVVVANNIRALQMLEELPNACAANKLKTADRAARFYYSDLPQTLFPGLKLYTLKNSGLAHHLTGIKELQGRISVVDALAFVSEKQFGLVGGRRYGDQLDPLLAKTQWQFQIWRRTAADMGAGMVDMLLRGRISALIEHPNSAHHYARELGKENELQGFDLQETPNSSMGYIICSKTPQGLALKQHFDGLLQQVSRQQTYLDTHLAWMPTLDQQAYIDLYNEVYGTRFTLVEVSAQAD